MDTELSDDQWEVIRPLIPAQGRMGRPRADDRRVVNGIPSAAIRTGLYVLKSGYRWKDLPQKFGHPYTCWWGLKRWEKHGVWDTTLDEHGRPE